MKSRVARIGFTLSAAFAVFTAAAPAQACCWPFGWGWGGGYSTYYAPSYRYASYAPSYSYSSYGSYAPSYGPSCDPCGGGCSPCGGGGCSLYGGGCSPCGGGGCSLYGGGCSPCGGGGCSLYGGGCSPCGGGGCATGACGVSYRGGTSKECCQPSNGGGQTFEPRRNGQPGGPSPDQNFQKPATGDDVSPGDSAGGGYETQRQIEQRPAPTGQPEEDGTTEETPASENPNSHDAGMGPQIPAFKNLDNKIASHPRPARQRLAIRASFSNPVVARRTVDLNRGWVPVSTETRLVKR